MAEIICQDAYEKKFNTDLSLPRSHPKNMRRVSHTRRHLMEQMQLWGELDRTDNIMKENDPVKIALSFVCAEKRIRTHDKLMQLKDICICKKEATKICSGCKIDKYCSLEYQRVDWKLYHKEECKTDFHS